MNVLSQLIVNRAKCEDRLINAQKMLDTAQFPFEVHQARIAVTKAKKSLDMVTLEIAKEEDRQDADERAWLDV